MPKGSKILGRPINEEKWAEAKERASKEGHAGEYDYIMEIYKRMGHLGEYKPEHVAERKEKKQKLPAWKKKNWDSKRRQLKESVKKSSSGRFQLVIGGKDLNEYRCDSCGHLLMRGRNLEKAIVEIKCKWCGALARTH